jgi:thiamine-phosphate pyrophosphorylase
VAAGVDWVQIRERGLEGGELLRLADAVSAAARRAARPGARVCILVNRRVDVALAIGADGVHLGFDAMDPTSARGLLSDAARIGLSTHAPGEIARARDISYAQLAPVFAPRSKRGTRPPLGPRVLREATELGLPVLAQGGIDASNAAEVIRAGAAGVAVTGAILMSADPADATARLRSALDRAAS